VAPIGSGRNGKSVKSKISLGILGDYATTAPSDLFMVTSLGKHPTDIADLEGYRCVITTEIEPGQRLRIGLIKQLTGGDNLKARKMRQAIADKQRRRKGSNKNSSMQMAGARRPSRHQIR
jgi:phage/plasmid-associated DNA primase